ncbi:DUF4043 family protein [Comamonas piscis]|uniref:DUF4043 family protein n=1 Tax=Comamonas piscis TaxID=1562974 RepID=A0A7G5EJG1_9BURK|nr:DUF4043 family protein [Comamonas piscis]QMV74136.1 DUF4043 family protein [Comamonas piscis]WSO32576.1 DUF4043 family protein [Comamonas piscis]
MGHRESAQSQAGKYARHKFCWVQDPDLGALLGVGSQIRESTVPLQGIKYENDDKYWNSPLYVWFVSERQFLYLKQRGTTSQWAKAVADAVARKVPGAKHPLFDNMETIMWGGMLIATLKRYAMPPLYTAVTPEMLASTIDLIDLDTGEPIGQQLPAVILVAGLGSLFIREDFQQSQQVLGASADRPPIAPEAS